PLWIARHIMTLQRIARAFRKRFGSSWWLRPGPRNAYRPYRRLALESLEDRTLLDASLNQLFVQRGYSELLGREPEPVGEQGWVSILEQGGSQRQVVIGIENSPEYWSRQVRFAYENILHREPEEAGYLGWSLNRQSVGGERELQANFLGSVEYVQNAG